LHSHTLRLREPRAEIVAANLANAAPPNFKARDKEPGLALKVPIPAFYSTAIMLSRDRTVGAKF
jgi:hypothetical protein